MIAIHGVDRELSHLPMLFVNNAHFQDFRAGLVLI